MGCRMDGGRALRKTYRFDYRGQGQAIDPTTQKMVMLHSDTGKLWSGCRLGDKQFQSTIDEGFLWWSDRTRAELRTPWPFSTGRETSAKSGFRQERRRTSRLRQGAARMALSSGVSPRDAEPQEPTSSWWCAHPQEQLLLQTDCRKPDPGLVALPPPLLLVTANLEGAVLFPEPGYALVAGTSAFLAGAAPEGVDQARARFARYARAAARRWPVLESTARSFPPRQIAWKYPSDVPEATATGQQLALMRDVAAGRCTGAEFAVGWLNARRRSQQQGERVRDPLETLLDRVFSLLEDYSIDPRFKEPGDLSDDELQNAVTELLLKAE